MGRWDWECDDVNDWKVVCVLVSLFVQRKLCGGDSDKVSLLTPLRNGDSHEPVWAIVLSLPLDAHPHPSEII